MDTSNLSNAYRDTHYAHAPSINFDELLAGAKRYVEMYPLVSQPDETRTFMHAMLNYFQELGVRRVERDRILAAWTEATLAASERGFNIGWDKGYEYGKSKTAPPF